MTQSRESATDGRIDVSAPSLAEGTAAYARARDWDDVVHRAWRAAVAAVRAADGARATLAGATVRLRAARDAVAALQTLPPPQRGEGAHRSRLWHEASAALREATVSHASVNEAAATAERTERLRVMEFEHARDDSPYVAALWRECIRLGAVPETVANCREEVLG